MIRDTYKLNCFLAPQYLIHIVDLVNEELFSQEDAQISIKKIIYPPGINGLMVNLQTSDKTQRLDYSIQVATFKYPMDSEARLEHQCVGMVWVTPNESHNDESFAGVMSKVQGILKSYLPGELYQLNNP